MPEASEYLKKHGITMEIAESLRLGYYDPSDEAAKAVLESTGLKDPTEGPTLIVPFSFSADDDDVPYWEGIDMATDRTIMPNIDQAIRGTAILSAADIYIPNRPIWIAGSVQDLLAYKAWGASAVYVNPIGLPELERQLKEHPNGMPIILSPCDRTDEGIKHMKALASDYASKGIPATVPNPEQIPKEWAGPTGAAATLTKNAKALGDFIDGTEKAVIEGRTWERQIYESSSAGDRIFTRFWDVKLSASRQDAISTGLEELDRKLDGGLYPGLYVIGAVSSLGKTSLMLQIADAISCGGHDVLFFTAEQSADELIAKSLSRITGQFAKQAKQDSLSTRHISARSILRGGWGDADAKILERAGEMYRKTARRLWIVEDDRREGIDDTRIGLDTIRNRVRNHVKVTKNRPVVIIDYLQIIANDDMTGGKVSVGSKSDKQAMDEMVSELRRLSKTEQVPIIAISSLNRAAYNGVVGMDAFKESGAIEYGSDVVMALQPRGMSDGDEGRDRKHNKQAYQALENTPTRELEIHIMKNRLGQIGNVPVQFDAEYGEFKSGTGQ